MVNPASVLAFLTKFGAKEALKKFKPKDIKDAVSARNQQVIGEWNEVFKKGKIKDVDFDKERENLTRAVSAGKSDTSVFSKNIQATTDKAAPLLDEVYTGQKSFVDFNKAIPSPEKFTFLPEMTSPVKMKAALDSGKRSKILGDANGIKIQLARKFCPRRANSSVVTAPSVDDCPVLAAGSRPSTWPPPGRPRTSRKKYTLIEL